MGLLSRLGGRGKALTGTPALLEVLNNRQANTMIPLGGTNLNLERINSVYVATQNASYGWIYRTQPAVRRTIDYQAGNVAQLGLKLYERVDDDDRKQVGDHPAAQTLRRPNPQTPGKKFIRGFVTDFLAYDNAYALKFRLPNGKRWLYGLSPAMVGIVGQSHFSVDAYRIWRMDGSYFDVRPEDMLHWRGENPEDPRRGESKLETLREELAADAAARQANTELHRSGLALPGWIERPIEAPEWTEEARKRFEEDFANRAKGGKRKSPVLEEGMVFKQGGVTPEDAELLAARTWTNEQVASLYGMNHVPPESDEERRQFYRDVLPDITGLLADFLGLSILEQEYGLADHYFEFSLDEKLMGEDRLKALTSAAGAPIFTRNEARAMANLPAKEGGDELITPLNVTEGGKPSTGVMPPQDPNKPDQDGSHRSGEADEPARAGRQSLNGHVKAPLIPRRRLASLRRDRWAGEYQGVLDRHFDRQQRAMKSKKASKAITDDRWNTELGNDLNDVAQRQFEAEGKHVAFRLASTFDPDYGENWLKSKSLGSAQDINRITQEQADELGLDKAFDQGATRAAAAGMAYATDIAAFSTKVATEQAPGEPTVTIDGGECDICAPFQGSWPVSQLEQWPSYHPSCGCVADVEGGVVKALPAETKEQPITVNNHPPNVYLQVAEGAFKSETTVEPNPPANIKVTTPDVKVEPAVVNFAEGAISAPVHVEAAPPADVRTVFDKGAIHVENPVNVEAAPPADIRFVEGAIQANIEAPNVNVAPAEAPNVNVEVKGGKTKRTVTFSDGHTAEIEDKSSTSRTVKFSDGRTAEINESDEDDQRPSED